MRCRVGDLCVVVACKWPENIGLLVTVLALDEPGIWLIKEHGRVGRVKTAGVVRLRGNEKRLRALDNQLRPIRDEPGTDETLTWAPLEMPREVIKELTR